MIDIIKQTPRKYSAFSRDYQVLARLYTALFNYTKMYIDNMQIWNSNIDNNLAELRSRTLNFEPKYSWNLDNLEAITTCFKYLIRNKGTIRTLKYCIDILMRIEGLISNNLDSAITVENYNVTIRIPKNLLTLGIIEDLARYLLPAGLTYDIVEYEEVSSDKIFTDIYHISVEDGDEITRKDIIENSSIIDMATIGDDTERENIYGTRVSNEIFGKQRTRNITDSTYINEWDESNEG